MEWNWDVQPREWVCSDNVGRLAQCGGTQSQRLDWEPLRGGQGPNVQFEPLREASKVREVLFGD
jgi:hypothetical protein